MANMSRRTFLGVFGLAITGVAAACSSGSSTSGGSSTTTSAAAGDPLFFDKSAYTEKTATISTVAGDTEVTYRLYSKIPYVAKPVDAAYQSLSIAVPTKVGGKDVDATDAPILFEIPVGGYLPAETTDDPFANGGRASGGMTPGGAAPGGAAPGGAAPDGAPSSGAMPSGAMSSGAMPSGSAGAVAGGLPTGAGSTGQNTTEALAAGWVVVSVGARGRTNQSSDGTYFGKAPAVIVDLKAAVRYLKANKGRVPGDVDKIISDGTSAGGAVSVLLGVSGDSPLYDTYLTELGAADASDSIFAVGAYCPIADLENADKAYEFLFGSLPANGAAVDQTVSQELAGAFPAYQDSLQLQGLDGRPLTGERYRDYLLATYLQPAATTYLNGLSEADRSTYLSSNPWVQWSGGKATFAFADYLTHLGSRKKTEPAFDAFDLSAGENSEFGTTSTNARHFTDYSLKRDTSGTAGGSLDSDIPNLLRLMNPTYHVAQRNPNRAKNYFLRVGTSDTDTAPIIVGNLAAGFHGLGDNVDSLMYWDKGHGANDDPDKFVAWANALTGHSG